MMGSSYMYTHDLTEGLGGWRYRILYYTKLKLTTEGVWRSRVHHVNCYDVVIIETANFNFVYVNLSV